MLEIQGDYYSFGRWGRCEQPLLFHSLEIGELVVGVCAVFPGVRSVQPVLCLCQDRVQSPVFRVGVPAGGGCWELIPGRGGHHSPVKPSPPNSVTVSLTSGGRVGAPRPGNVVIRLRWVPPGYDVLTPVQQGAPRLSLQSVSSGTQELSATLVSVLVVKFWEVVTSGIEVLDEFRGRVSDRW